MKPDEPMKRRRDVTSHAAGAVNSGKEKRRLAELRRIKRRRDKR